MYKTRQLFAFTPHLPDLLFFAKNIAISTTCASSLPCLYTKIPRRTSMCCCPFFECQKFWISHTRCRPRSARVGYIIAGVCVQKCFLLTPTTILLFSKKKTIGFQTNVGSSGFAASVTRSRGSALKKKKIRKQTCLRLSNDQKNNVVFMMWFLSLSSNFVKLPVLSLGGVYITSRRSILLSSSIPNHNFLQ